MKPIVSAGQSGTPLTHQSPITTPNVRKCPKMSDLGRLSQLGGLIETNRPIFHKLPRPRDGGPVLSPLLARLTLRPMSEAKSFLVQKFARIPLGAIHVIGYSVAGEETPVPMPARQAAPASQA